MAIFTGGITSNLSEGKFIAYGNLNFMGGCWWESCIDILSEPFRSLHWDLHRIGMEGGGGGRRRGDSLLEEIFPTWF